MVNDSLFPSLSFAVAPSFLQLLLWVRGLAACKLGILLPAPVGVIALAEQFRMQYELRTTPNQQASNLHAGLDMTLAKLGDLRRKAS